MQTIRFKPLSLLMVAAVLALGSLGSITASSVEAASVSGQVSGTWDIDFDGPGGLNVGDTFTGDYTYDDTQITTNDYSIPGDIFLENNAPLLSFVLNSGSISQVFDFTNGSGYISTYYYSGAPSGSPAQVELYANDYTLDSNGNPLFEKKFVFLSRGLDSNSGPYAYALSRNYLTATFPINADSFNATLSGAVPPVPTPVPTPALLPGLIGMSVAAWRKRQTAAANNGG